jgi:hypothetical protein
VLTAHLSTTVSADDIVGGPLMTLVQPLDQISSDYTFVAIRPQYSTDAEFHHFVDVITDTSATMSLVIDSRIPTASDYFRNWTSIAHTGLSSAVLRVSTGYHRIYTLGGHSIGGKVYGLRQNEAYGFPLGFVARGQSLWTSKELNSLLWWSNSEAAVTTESPKTTTAASNTVDYSTHKLTTYATNFSVEKQITVASSERNMSNVTTVDDRETLYTISANVSSSVQSNVAHLFTKSWTVSTEQTADFSAAVLNSTTSGNTNFTSDVSSNSTPETFFTHVGGVTVGTTSPADVTSHNSSNNGVCCTSDTLNVTATPEHQSDAAKIITTHEGINITNSHSIVNSTLFEFLNLTIEWHNESTTTQSLQMYSAVINSTHDAADWRTKHATVDNATINDTVSWRNITTVTSATSFLPNVNSTTSDIAVQRSTDFVTSSVWPDDSNHSTDISILNSTSSRDNKSHSTHEAVSGTRRISHPFSTTDPITTAKKHFTTAANQAFTGQSTDYSYATASSGIPFNFTANVSVSPAARLEASSWSPLGIMLTGSILGTLLALVSCVLCVVLICSSFDKVTSRRVIMTMARGRKANRVGPETVFIPGLDDESTEEAGYRSMMAAMSECSIRGVTSWSPSVSASRADVMSHDCMPINARRWSAKIVPLTPGYRSAGPDGMSMVELSSSNVADMFNVVSASHQLPKKHHHHGKNMSTFIQSVASLHPGLVAEANEQSRSETGVRSKSVGGTIEDCKVDGSRRRPTDGGTFVLVNEGHASSQTGDNAAPNQQPRNRGLRTSTWIVEDPTNRDKNGNAAS